MLERRSVTAHVPGARRQSGAVGSCWHPAWPSPPGRAPRQAPTSRSDPFTLGCASGDPDATSVVLWTRLTGHGGSPPTTVDVTWEARRRRSFADVVASGDRDRARADRPQRPCHRRASPARHGTGSAPATFDQPARSRRAASRRPGRAAHRRGELPALRDRLLRRPSRHRRVGARSRASSSVTSSTSTAASPLGGNVVRIHEGAEPHDLDDYRARYAHVPRRRRPAGGAGGVPVAGRLGRPRGREQLCRAHARGPRRARRRSPPGGPPPTRRGGSTCRCGSRAPVEGRADHDLTAVRRGATLADLDRCSTAASSAPTRPATTSPLTIDPPAPTPPCRSARCSATAQEAWLGEQLATSTATWPVARPADRDDRSHGSPTSCSTTTSGTATTRPASGCSPRLRPRPTGRSCSPATSTSPGSVAARHRGRVRHHLDLRRPPTSRRSWQRRCRQLRQHRRRRVRPPWLHPPRRHAGRWTAEYRIVDDVADPASSVSHLAVVRRRRHARARRGHRRATR